MTQQVPQLERAPRNKRPTPESEWDRAQLLAEDSKVRDGTWSHFLASLRFAPKVPMESLSGVLECGYTFCVQLEALNTTSCPVLFH